MPSSKLRIIGDVHGKYEQYHNLIHNCEDSIQVGDMGFDYTYLIDNVDSNKHKFLGGNHENYHMFKSIPHSLPDYGIMEKNGIKIGFVRGAWSIDWQYRTEYLDWFREEELTAQELINAVHIVSNFVPDIIITHTCPEIVKLDILKTQVTLSNGKDFKTLTERALQGLYNYHKPKLWIFGHWHCNYNKDWIINDQKTRFICLNELHFLDLDLDNKERFGIL